MRIIQSILLLLIISLTSCTKTPPLKYVTIEKTDANGYIYKEVTNDPTHSRIYELKNGLKVYLSVNKEQPRIQTYIPVRAGSSYDPPATTGLAHYLEHMMFKGSSRFGTINWAKEEPLLKQVSDLYEQHRATQSSVKKAEIYTQIDKVSQEAAKYAIPNEYGKLLSIIGAKGTNAYTSTDRTVYVNNIPSNELERWLQIESERFSKLVLRLFHTELEAVYEEFNMGQDRESTRVFEKLFQLSFPGHPYGTQTTIGRPEHLRNPSLVNIHNYFDKYYVPNNMAICLSGDLDMEKTILLIDKYWGKFEKEPLKKKTYSTIPEDKQNRSAEVFGPKTEMLYMGYRFGGEASTDYPYVILIGMLLSNSTAGLIDLDINQQQKVLDAGSFPVFMEEYGLQVLYGVPRKGQTLKQVETLLIQEIDKIKKGEFDNWMIKAVVGNLIIDHLKALAQGQNAAIFVESFISQRPWVKYVDFYDFLSNITKEKIMSFAQKYYNHHAVVYKRKGKPKNITKVDKPKITSVPTNRTFQSYFFKKIINEKVKPIKPLFIDYKTAVKKEELQKDVELYVTKNKENELFTLTYLFDMGKANSRKLSIALEYLNYLGTDKYSPEDFKKELYKNSIDLNVFSSNDKSYVIISGLRRYLSRGISLVEDLLEHAKINNDALENLKRNLLKKRKDDKLNKNIIFNGNLYQYTLHGAKNILTDLIPEHELKGLKADDLMPFIHNLTKYPHKITYYGDQNADEIMKILKQEHKLPAKLLRKIPAHIYPFRKTIKNEVFFVNYDMVQAILKLVNNKGEVPVNDFPKIRMFNEYYGGNMGSIIFQEIRESRALAYYAGSYFIKPLHKEDPNLLIAVIYTQVDKFNDAANTMKNLLTNMPKAESSFDNARKAIISKIESERLTGKQILKNYIFNEEMGYKNDLRKDDYNYAKTATLSELEAFFNKRVKSKHYSLMVIGDRKKLTKKELIPYGNVKELSLKEIFNY